MQDTENTTLTIEKSIEIAASVARVWALVNEPGWWINDGTYTEHVIEQRDGISFVTDPTHGVFPIVTVTVEEPTYLAYRWLARTDEPTADGPGTLTEFWLEERGGGVRLRVRESGFENLDETEAQLLKTIDENTSGWDQMLDLAKVHCEP